MFGKPFLLVYLMDMYTLIYQNPKILAILKNTEIHAFWGACEFSAKLCYVRNIPKTHSRADQEK